MRPDLNPQAEARAIDWVIRQRDPDFADWDGFADWLAEDPAHADLFDAVASLDRDLEALPAPPARVIVDEAPLRAQRRVSRRVWFGGSIAAALVAIVSLPSVGLFGSGIDRIETAAGEHRSIKLADGTMIEVNGASVVELDGERPRFARLVAGEAMFRVVHRAEAPFVVEAGGDQIVDLGTAFNVVRRKDATAVAVSEGVVVYNPEADNVRMTAGQGIEARDGDSRPPAVRPVEIANVGGWRTGLLVYNGTPLAIVAEDLERTAGMKVSVAPEAAGVDFRGALIIAKDRGRTIADLAALSGTRAERRGDGWVLSR